MATELMGSRTGGIAFLVSAGIVYEIIAAACSSPQTAEINAHKRAGTLMKWVHLGLVQAAAFVLVAGFMDPGNRNAIWAGGATAALLMWAQYQHALDAGLRSFEGGTEG